MIIVIVQIYNLIIKSYLCSRTKDNKCLTTKQPFRTPFGVHVTRGLLLTTPKTNQDLVSSLQCNMIWSSAVMQSTALPSLQVLFAEPVFLLFALCKAHTFCLKLLLFSQLSRGVHFRNIFFGTMILFNYFLI